MELKLERRDLVLPELVRHFEQHLEEQVMRSLDSCHLELKLERRGLAQPALVRHFGKYLDQQAMRPLDL